jgi:2-succinyl-5-enolpyruvyl-6-hydroxy-3-cyclohexene-1-carboxylate synthase
MSRTWSHLNFYQAELVVEKLMRRGVRMFFVAPGSRSSPLALAVSKLAGEYAIVHFDERGLAFAAIGYARATRTPAVLICTSGTAAANFLPAIVEASMSAIPLVILTADRPPELHNRGANQTIPQRGIFGNFVRFEGELESPSEGFKPSEVIDTIASAIQYASGIPSGPVHINCPYREPLAPSHEEHSFAEYIGELQRSTNQIPGVVHPHTDSAQLDWLAKRIQSARSGLVVIGRLDSIIESGYVAAFANATGWTVAADVTSQLRFTKQCSRLCEHFDLLLLNNSAAEAIQPEMVVHIGGEFVSKRLTEHFERNHPVEYAHISDDPRRRDPSESVTKQITLDLSTLPGNIKLAENAAGNVVSVSQLNQQIRDHIASRFDNTKKLTEIGVARAVVANAPPKSALFLASSLAIRLVDMYAPVTDKSILVGSNRGASGIDGTIASAVGFARGCGRPTTLLIGDLAFLHDLNSLAMVREARVSFVIVLINNNGGGIFHLLPIADSNTQFERFWGTPHGLNFGGIAAEFGLRYSRPENVTAFHAAFTAAHSGSTAALIEVCILREESAELIRRLQHEIKTMLV